MNQNARSRLSPGLGVVPASSFPWLFPQLHAGQTQDKRQERFLPGPDSRAHVKKHVCTEETEKKRGLCTK